MVPPNMQIKDRAGGPAGVGAGSIAEARALRDKAGRKEGVLSLVLFISLRALFRGRSVVVAAGASERDMSRCVTATPFSLSLSFTISFSSFPRCVRHTRFTIMKERVSLRRRLPSFAPNSNIAAADRSHPEWIGVSEGANEGGREAEYKTL